MKYRKKPVVIDAEQWFKNGDHPEDGGETTSELGWESKPEGKVVRYFRRPDVEGTNGCKKCSARMHFHGWIDTLEGGHIVCPGDFIITGIEGEKYPCKPDIFENTYDLVEEDAGA